MSLFLVRLVNCFLVCFVVFFVEDYEMGDKRKKVVVTMEAVSYTHLDVYKRQAQKYALLLFPRLFIIAY